MASVLFAFSIDNFNCYQIGVTSIRSATHSDFQVRLSLFIDSGWSMIQSGILESRLQANRWSTSVDSKVSIQTWFCSDCCD
jgi:hypothetical protein